MSAIRTGRKLWQGRVWSVTRYGIERHVGFAYVTSPATLQQADWDYAERGAHSPIHIARKPVAVFDPLDFLEAFRRANSLIDLGWSEEEVERTALRVHRELLARAERAVACRRVEPDMEKLGIARLGPFPTFSVEQLVKREELATAALPALREEAYRRSPVVTQ